ncbi:hypothetical protein BDZ89DRAFT_1056094 [Hymenopellis radicata]|nr:hypothetical protein BDZ89DRAFT_1056094 [Hymenopellis radicata]
MVLLLGSDAGSLKGRAERLSNASSTTLAPPAPTTRISKWILCIHLFHALLVLVFAVILVVGIMHWEHAVEVDIESAFFTVVIVLLTIACRTIGVDKAVRHPRSLFELDTRIRVWSGLPAAISTWFTRSPSETRSRLHHPFRSIYFGIPLYLLAGTILQLSASGVLGVSVYRYSMVSTSEYSASSHSGNYGFSQVGVTVVTDADQRALWSVARKEMFLAKVNNTQHPGIHASVLHDVPAPLYSYDLVTVNATRVNVQCAQPTDAVVEMLLLAPNSNDASNPLSVIKSGGVGGPKTPTDNQVWLNVTMSKPPYWDSSPGLVVSDVWAHKLTGLANVGLPTEIMLQPWKFSGEGVVGHQQVIFVLATGDPSFLLRDSTGSTGLSTNFTISSSYDGGDGDDDDDEEEEEEEEEEGTIKGYVQVIGCTMESVTLNVSVTQAGLLADGDTPQNPPPHEWGVFEWEETDMDIDRQFLIAFTGDDIVQQFLGKALCKSNESATLQGLEATLELLATSYLWNYWQKCSLPSMVYSDDCTSFGDLSPSSGPQSSHGSVSITMSNPEAHLQIIFWRALVSFVASLALAALAVSLLGWRTDLSKTQRPKDVGTARMVQLMQESSLPVVISENDGLDIPIRYQSSADGRFENLDYCEGEKGA